METNLFIVPNTHIHQFWHLAEDHLQRAIETGNGEFNISQLRQFVAQGSSVLLLIMKDKECLGALTVQWINYPNDRVAYITYIGGYTDPRCWEQFVTWVKNNGGTKVQGSTAKQSIVRLWRMKWNMQPKYTLMELKL
jgi:predicted oxidoreductase (fatty acid repression mutant protein)